MIKRWHLLLSTAVVAGLVLTFPRAPSEALTRLALLDNSPVLLPTGSTDTAAPSVSLPQAAATGDDGPDVTGALPHLAIGTPADLRAALDAVEADDFKTAMGISAGLDPLQRDVVTFVAIRRGVDALTPQVIGDFARRHPDWPTAQMMRKRAEEALAGTSMQPADIVAAFAGSAPVTEAGRFALVRAYQALGRNDDALKLFTEYWTTEPLSADREGPVATSFADMITPAMNKSRFDMLMYADRVTQAGRLAARLGPDFAALADARAAVLRDLKEAGSKLDHLPEAARKDPLYAFTLAEWHRRADRPKDAAKALMSVDPALTEAHGDAWWVERRIVSRELLERGDPQTAYKLVAAHQGGDSETRTEAAFHAGWYALRFLKQADQAIPHFMELQKHATIASTKARASYWLGRCHEAAKRLKEAREHYRVAATYEATFYGQLALVKLDAKALGMPSLPEPTMADRENFARNDMVRAMTMLMEAGEGADAAVFYPALAKQLPSPGQLVLLSRYAEERGNHTAVLAIGKLAADRDLGVERLAFPLEAIPQAARSQKAIETAIVYAIARQESAFNPAAVSSAGAMGLLQLLPETAAATARKVGLTFSKDKLTGDAAYNAELGAAHLKELVGKFNGSYILTFAAYNAGGGKAREWIRRFGDPRDPAVDPVDWIELIPYGETRNYVQRVTENLQVYRDQLTGADLGIVTDLKRGG